jgi:cyclomaltodextrinase
MRGVGEWLEQKFIKIMYMKLMKIILFTFLGFWLLAASCGPAPTKNTTEDAKSLASVPAWAKEVVWYQIFVERFRNGDPNNDPTPGDMYGSYPEYIPEDWRITPWGHDWYSREPWLDKIKARGFSSKIQARRYGGDLQGVLDKIDYIQSLGVTAIYFNPLNDSPSLHKYDARNYTHIDRNFGPDPKGDVALMDSETPDDPSTWKWSAADKLFLTLIKEFHRRGIKVIMDYSWNHTGREFWALNDIKKNGKNSKFVDWYNIEKFDDPQTPENEFKYEGWGGGNIYMPVFKKDIVPPDDKVMPFEGNLHSESLKQHIFSVTKRWLDPDKDGNPADGVDGFRLDVSGEIPMGFWRDYRKVVRSVNPEAYIVGEIWWLEWPDKLLDPKVFLEGDQYDAIMNYRWYRIARGFFGQAEPVLTPTGFVKEIDRINAGIGTDNLQVMMNVSSSHDTPRLSTSLYNKTMDKYNAKPGDNPDYKINKPDALTLQEQRLLLVHQFTFIGAPQIWNGEEAGMWGADDPDCRKPLIWDDLVYEDERAAFDPTKTREADVVKTDTELFLFYQKLIKMRKENPVLVHGDLSFPVADDRKMVLAYSRTKGKDEIICVFNRSDKAQSVDIPVDSAGNFFDLNIVECKTYQTSGNVLKVSLEPLTAKILKRF